MNLIRFTNLQGFPIYINPDYVTFVKSETSHNPDPRTTIFTSNGAELIVLGQIGQVVDKLTLSGQCKVLNI